MEIFLKNEEDISRRQVKTIGTLKKTHESTKWCLKSKEMLLEVKKQVKQEEGRGRL